jgi:hypothetical protein
MFYVVGFILSLILVVYSAYKLWIDRAEHTAKGRLGLEVVMLLIGLGGAILSLINGVSGGQKVAALNQSLAATQSYVVAAEEGRAPRSLTADQQQIMVRDLQALGPPQTIAFYWDATSVEAKRYALQILVPFQQARWNVPIGGNKFGVPDFPIYIGFAPGKESVANGVAKAFEDAGLVPHVEPTQNLSPQITIEVDVGDKP